VAFSNPAGEGGGEPKKNARREGERTKAALCKRASLHERIGAPRRRRQQHKHSRARVSEVVRLPFVPVVRIFGEKFSEKCSTRCC